MKDYWRRQPSFVVDVHPPVGHIIVSESLGDGGLDLVLFLGRIAVWREYANIIGIAEGLWCVRSTHDSSHVRHRWHSRVSRLCPLVLSIVA